jgi:hypothetical protein
MPPPFRLVRPAVMVLLLAACEPLPDTGADPATAGPPPPLVPLDDLLVAPAPRATAESAIDLAERGAALKSQTSTLD